MRRVLCQKKPTTDVAQSWIDGAVDVLHRTVLARAVRAWDVFVCSSLYITSIAVVEGWLATELLGLEPNAALAITRRTFIGSCSRGRSSRTRFG